MGMGHVHRHQVGRYGESIAHDFLVRRGAHILGRNVRIGRGEIDLVIRHDGEVIAVEVKTIVETPWSIDPLDHFTTAKAAQVARLGRAHDPPVTRIDAVGVALSERGVAVRWLVGAA